MLDPQGECWEVAGLYCCDGSTFPTPTGASGWSLCVCGRVGWGWGLVYLFWGAGEGGASSMDAGSS